MLTSNFSTETCNARRYNVIVREKGSSKILIHV